MSEISIQLRNAGPYLLKIHNSKTSEAGRLSPHCDYNIACILKYLLPLNPYGSNHQLLLILEKD
jgi:hypothetical protein